MSLMGSLYTGVSGLQTSNNALNTTAHNMSNLDTQGYTRQQVAQGTRNYVTLQASATKNWMQTGLGVNYTRTRQERDTILDRNFRRESGRSAFMMFGRRHWKKLNIYWESPTRVMSFPWR